MSDNKIFACDKDSKLTPDGDKFIWSTKVHRGSQVIQSFELTPVLPVLGEPAKYWPLTDPCRTEPVSAPKHISNVVIEFSKNSSDAERLHERAVLIVNIKQRLGDTGVWRFAKNGVQVDHVQADDSDVGVEISDDGKTLIAYIHVYEGSSTPNPGINFGFVAAYTNESGEVKTYESSDPVVNPVRPK